MSLPRKFVRCQSSPHLDDFHALVPCGRALKRFWPVQKNTFLHDRQQSGKLHTVPTVSPRFVGLNWEKTLSPQATDLLFPRYTCLLSPTSGCPSSNMTVPDCLPKKTTSSESIAFEDQLVKVARPGLR